MSKSIEGDYNPDCQDQIIRAARRLPFLERSNDQQALLYAIERIAELEAEVERLKGYLSHTMDTEWTENENGPARRQF